MMTVEQWQHAVRLWDAGFDTAQIAEILGVRECVIYNKLWKWRVTLQVAA